MKTKYIRANNAPFMNKVLSKAVMKRSRLRNKYLKCPSNDNKLNYKKQRNYCTSLLKKEKKTFYDNIDITDNKTIEPFFSEKHFSRKKMFLVENEKIASNDHEVAEFFIQIL